MLGLALVVLVGLDETVEIDARVELILVLVVLEVLDTVGAATKDSSVVFQNTLSMMCMTPLFVKKSERTMFAVMEFRVTV